MHVAKGLARMPWGSTGRTLTDGCEYGAQLSLQWLWTLGETGARRDENEWQPTPGSRVEESQ